MTKELVEFIVITVGFLTIGYFLGRVTVWVMGFMLDTWDKWERRND